MQNDVLAGDGGPNCPWIPDAEDVRRYRRHGWFITPAVLPHALLDAVRSAIDAHHAGRRDRQLPRQARFSDWRPGDGDGVRNNEFCSLQNHGVRALAQLPLIGAIAARLSGCDTIRLFDDQAIYKPPVATSVVTAVGWHTDHSYWSNCTSQHMLTAWIPLHDSNEDNGTLYVIDGSHLWPESEHLREFNNPNLEGLGERLGRPIPGTLIRPVNIKKGQISFHHMRTLHASAANTAPTARYAVAVHLQDGENTYRQFTTEQGVVVELPHDQLCRRNASGLPDYTDPDVFPTLWSPEHRHRLHA